MDLVTDEGINASAKDEIYGCIFGRDSAITILKILRIVEKGPTVEYIDSQHLLTICKRSLLTLTALTGRHHNLESGEEPGKFIHEYRKEKYEHLFALPKPWYVYPDRILRNYDSLDATPLALIAIHKYWQVTGDGAFLRQVLPSVERGLQWIISYGDKDSDSLVEYDFPKERTHGGVEVQSWTDSLESLKRKDASMPPYPIAPVEVQGYVWLAFRLWSDVYAQNITQGKKAAVFAKKLAKKAHTFKKRFNETFIFKDNNLFFAAQALDGNKKQIQTVTGNPLLLLWSTYSENGELESILEEKYVDDFVKRVFLPDMYHPKAGIRTMSSQAQTFNPGQDSYHNGSFWPVLNGMIHEGLQVWGYQKEAKALREATLLPIVHFGTPIELYILDNKENYMEYKNLQGQVSCRVQAWSAAAALDLLT
jgi:glycogen debranching enzyme